MSKIIILYDSRSGTTEKMAHTIAEGAKQVKGIEVQLLKVGQRFNLSMLDKADAIIFGSPNYYNNVTPEFERVLENLKEYKDQYNLDGKIGESLSHMAGLGALSRKKSETIWMLLE